MKNLFFFLFIFSSCISNNTRIQQQEENLPITEPPYTISLEKEIDNIQSVDLTEIGDTIIYIPLETNDLSLLKDLMQIIVTNSYIVVRDADNILMFDSSGHFLRQIGRRGQGPGEYKNILDYCFSSDNNYIYLLTTFYQCLEFNVEGKFMKSFKIDSMPSQMLPSKEDLFAFHCINAPGYVNPTKQSLIISDLNNNIQKTYENYHKRTKQPGITISRVPFYYHQGTMRFKEFGVDTLYTITEEKLIPHAIFNLGSKELPADLQSPLMEFKKTIKENYAGKYTIVNLLEDDDNIYIRLSDYFDDLYGYYNKPNNNVKIIGEQGFQNNIDGGLPFIPRYVYNDSILVDYVNAFTLREHVLKSNATEMKRLYGQKYDDLVKLVNSLDDESNPVVVMVKK